MLSSLLSRFPWRVLGILAILNIVASIIILPYALAFQAAEETPIAFQSIILLVVQVASAILVYVPLAAIGLLAGSRIGLGAPILAAWSAGSRPPHRPGLVVLLSLGLGALTGVVVILVAQSGLNAMVQAEMQSMGITPPDIPLPSAWQGFLAAISAGITEETLLRLFLFTWIAWAVGRVRHTPDGYPTPAVLWFANIAASGIFGLLHLPFASSLMPLTPWGVIQILTLNGLAGLVFGWLYWKLGLESAMLAHFSADVVLHVIPPLVWG